MTTVYFYGALITAVAAIVGSIPLSDPRHQVSPLFRVAVAILAGAIWPVVAIGALQAVGFSLLGRRGRAEFAAQSEATPLKAYATVPAWKRATA